MPAAVLSHLREQTSWLVSQIDRPEAFHRALRDLLDLYANHAYRAGVTVQSQMLIPSYRVPPLVYRQIEIELTRACQALPVQSLAVCDALWTDDHLEPRLLAAAMLGQMPAEQDDQVLDRLRAWSRPDEDRQMLNALLSHGTLRLRRENPDPLLALIQTWLAGSEYPVQELGLKALLAIIKDEEFHYFPPIFRLLVPHLQNVPQPLMNDLNTILRALAHRTPAETIYLLRQVLSTSINPNTARLVRRILPEFEPQGQSSLREALRGAQTLPASTPE